MTLSDSSNFIVADDHPLFREALIHAIHNCVPGAVIHEADSLASLYEVVEAHADADLLFLDLHRKVNALIVLNPLLYLYNIIIMNNLTYW